MGEDHPTQAEIQRFAAGTLDRATAGRLMRHLLAGCEVCRAAVRASWGMRRQPPPRRERPTESLTKRLAERVAAEAPEADEGSYERAFARAGNAARRHEIEVAHERIVAPGLVAVLEEMTEERQRQAIEDERRFQTWGLCERLMQESRDRGFAGAPAQAERLARLALEVAAALDPGRYGAPLVEDLKARAWSELANAQRAAGDFAEARRSFEQSHRRLTGGSGDPYERARVTCLESSLLLELGCWEEAAAILDGPLALYRSRGDHDMLARALVQRAIPTGYLDPAAALEPLVEAERLTDRTGAPRLFLCARHNRILYTDDTGASEQALMLLQESRGLYRQFPDQWTQLRLRWVEARLAFSLGHLEEAEAALSLLWSSVFERRLRLDLALITLDLTAVYVAQGKMEKAWRTAGRLVPLFQAWGVHRHAMAAWLLLQRSFAAETATAGLIRDLERYLRRSWRNPDLAFEPAEG